MEKIFEQALLYDFYGELLTEHQQRIYEDVVYNDMSLGEIAQECGISRQGVHDLIKRCDRILQDYEQKLHLVERFTKAKQKIAEIVDLADAETNADADTEAEHDAEAEKGARATDAEMRQKRMQRIRKLAEQIMEEL
ncbi:MAG: YlxM family DNA-binding protein [Lachnospiraceae bacterium]|nr:YlxM family DNA-binding protein [Lachnospiraceae bacterium]